MGMRTPLEERRSPLCQRHKKRYEREREDTIPSEDDINSRAQMFLHRSVIHKAIRAKAIRGELVWPRDRDKKIRNPFVPLKMHSPWRNESKHSVHPMQRDLLNLLIYCDFMTKNTWRKKEHWRENIKIDAWNSESKMLVKATKEEISMEIVIAIILLINGFNAYTNIYVMYVWHKKNIWKT